jgi:hypothetical protein
VVSRGVGKSTAIFLSHLHRLLLVLIPSSPVLPSNSYLSIAILCHPIQRVKFINPPPQAVTSHPTTLDVVVRDIFTNLARDFSSWTSSRCDRRATKRLDGDNDGCGTWEYQRDDDVFLIANFMEEAISIAITFM